MINIKNSKLNKKLAGIILILGLLIILLNLNLISATDVCCERTISDVWCDDAPEDQCDSNYDKTNNLCEDTGFCNTGYCFNPSDGTCEAGSTEKACEIEEGEWSLDYNRDLCEEGCCSLAENTQYTTNARCQILSRDSSPNFDLTIPERECVFFNPNEWACLINENACRFTTEENCIETLNGEFFEGKFCSDSFFNLSYRRHYDKICHNEDIYWTDDKGNREDLFRNCVDGEEACNINEDGEPYCKSLKCWDEENEKWRVNRESWCKYDAYLQV